MAVTFTRIVSCLLLVHLASAGMTTILLRAVARAHGALHSERDACAQTLQMLDTNQDGHIDPDEVAAFAREEGLDSDSSTDDFSSVDVNGDGVLDPSELLQVVGGGGPKNSSAKGAASQSKPPLAVAVQATSVQERPHIVRGRAFEKPIAATSKYESPISIQGASKVRATVETPQLLDQLLRKEEARHAMKHAARLSAAAVKPPAAEPVKATPVERMVKHFAQVLRTAEVLPIHDETVRLAKNIAKRHATDTDGNADAGAARVTVQSAAKEVAEQLFIAESSQAKARLLDRKAAEQRANATVLAKLTMQESLNAAAAAAHSKANELLERMSKLEDQAERAQVRAAALHSKAKLETEEASELMATADRALNHVSSHAE